MSQPNEISDLIEAATRARDHAYAPYSDYRVGAAVRDADGRIWAGCNVENASSPLGVCAERNAIASMVANGGRQISEIVVVTKDGATPCGGCLQVLLEFSADPAETRVRTVADGGRATDYRLIELIPHGFRPTGIKRTER